RRMRVCPHPNPLPRAGEGVLSDPAANLPSPRVRGEGQGEGICHSFEKSPRACACDLTPTLFRGRERESSQTLRRIFPLPARGERVRGKSSLSPRTGRGAGGGELSLMVSGATEDLVVALREERCAALSI